MVIIKGCFRFLSILEHNYIHSINDLMILDIYINYDFIYFKVSDFFHDVFNQVQTKHTHTHLATG